MGISIDESLTWKELYKTIRNKFKRGISSLRKLKDILPQRKIEQVYKALFKSHLRYVDIIWNALSSTKLIQLQRLQTMGWKLLEDSRLKDGWNCKWLNVEPLKSPSIKKESMPYKFLHGLCPGIFATNLLKDP